MNKRKWLCIFFISTFFWSVSFAQVVVKRGGEGESNAQIIHELGVILTEKKQVVSIMMVLPEEHRPEEYKDIVVKKDDEILMVNKKRVKSLADFEKWYNELDIHELVKMGVRRDGELMIVEFNKIDPQNLPKGRKMMIRSAETDNRGGIKMKSFAVGSDGKAMEGIVPLIGTGLILKEENKKIIVKMKLKGIIENVDIQEGDEIVSFQGQNIKSLHQLVSDYENINIGDKISIGYIRQDKKMSCVFNRPEIKGDMMIKKEEKK